MGSESFVVILLAAVVVVVPTLFVSLASILIGAQNQDVTCDDGAVVELSTWLIVSGSLSLIGVFIFIIFCDLGMGSHIDLGTRSPIVFIVTIVLYLLFTLPWNIVGAFALFHDSSACKDQAYDLWAMTLAALINQWINILFSLCSRRGIKAAE